MSQGHPKLFCEKCRKTKPHIQRPGRNVFEHSCGSMRAWPRKAVQDTGIAPLKKEK